MAYTLAFGDMVMQDFKSFIGRHVIHWGMTPGFYYMTGVNLEQPRLGANGAGKSTLFDALFWVLTGETLTEKRPADAVVPWFGQRSCSVEQTFIRHGVEHVLIRARGTGNNKLTLASDGQPARVVEQPEINALLGLNADAFKRSILISQFGAMFLDMGASEQSAMFSEILNLDYWLDKAKEATAAKTAMEATAAATDRKLTADTGRYEGLHAQWNTLKVTKDDWQAKRAGRVAAVNTVVADRTADKLDRETELQEARDALTAAQAALDAADKPEDLNKELAALRTQHTTLNRTLIAERTAVQRLATAKTQADERLATANRSLARYTNTTDKTCPECGQTVSAKHIRDAKHALEADKATLAQAVGTAAGTLATAAAALKAKEDEDRRLVQAMAPLATREAAAARAYGTLEAAVTSADGNVRRAQRDVDSAVQAVTRALVEVERVKTEANPHAASLETLRLQLETLNDTLTQTDTLWNAQRAEVEIFAMVADHFREIRIKLIDEVLLELEVCSNQHAEALGLDGWSIRFATERETKAGTTALGFTTMVQPPGSAKAIRWSSFSGGERQRWQLAATFGLADVVLSRAGIECNIEGLDEPSQHLSPEGVSDLLEALADRARIRQKAVVLVEHHALDRGAFDHTMLVTKSPEGHSSLQIAA